MRKRLLLTLLFTFVLTACGTPTPTPTPRPTLTPTSAAPLPQGAITFTLDAKQSILNYVGNAALNIKLHGTIGISGQKIIFVPENGAYRVNLDIVFDGTTLTAVDGFVKSTMINSLEVDKFPTAHLIATSKDVVKLDTQPISFTASGSLDLHGITQIVEMPVTLTINNDSLNGTGDLTLELQDFKVNIPTALMSSKMTFQAVIAGAKSDQ